MNLSPHEPIFLIRIACLICHGNFERKVINFISLGGTRPLNVFRFPVFFNKCYLSTQKHCKYQEGSSLVSEIIQTYFPIFNENTKFDTFYAQLKLMNFSIVTFPLW